MTENFKVVRDPIHGNIQIRDYFVDLLETPEVQRLYNIKQLGFAHLVFPGAHHTRLEHSLGVYKIASRAVALLSLILEFTNPYIEQMYWFSGLQTNRCN